MPFFSLIVPVYNRETLIGRSLRSALAQDFADFEIVVVDDGSADASCEQVLAFDDRRIRLLRHTVNRGVGPARNTGIAAATGRWLVFLDSDDELVPGALARMHDCATQAGTDLHALWFRCRMDDGSFCPPSLDQVVDWDYQQYMRFLEATLHQRRDMIRCVRSECLQDLRYPDSRMLDSRLHLDFARRYRSRAYPDVLRLYHDGTGEQINLRDRQLDRIRAARSARDRQYMMDIADGYDALLEEHGAALSRHAPRLHRSYLRRALATALSLDRRQTARRHARALLRAAPFSSTSWRLWLRSWIRLSSASMQGILGLLLTAV